jgi:cytochrome P450
MSLARARGHTVDTLAAAAGSGVETVADGALRTHLVYSHRGCSQVLADAAFAPTGLASSVAAAGGQFDFDVSSIADFLRFNPLLKSGEDHQARRQQFLNHHNGMRKRFGDRFEALAERHFAVHPDPRGVGLTRALVEPYVDAAMCLILEEVDPAGPRLHDAVKGQAAVVFEYLQHPRSLRAKAAQVSGYLEQLSPHEGETPQARRERGLLMLAYSLQGRDPLVGGMGAFLHSLLGLPESERAARIETAEAREMFRMTSPVNYITRRATQHRDIAGTSIRPDEIVILMLPWANSGAKAGGEASLAFGHGAHVCAGQALALSIGEAWLTGLRRHASRLLWDDIEPDAVIPAVFRSYEARE